MTLAIFLFSETRPSWATYSNQVTLEFSRPGWPTDNQAEHDSE